MALEDKFHDAASRGNMDILTEGTKRELNQMNEDGITPTHCAAASGSIAALRVILGRGGNPEKADYLGQTALHHATKKGHIDCVTFLVNWGCNIWALDNSHHTAFDVSSVNNRRDIMKYLDQQQNIQLLKNRKTTEKMKEKAIAEYDKNVKRYEKLQQEAARKAEEENRKLREMQNRGQGNPTGKSTIRQKLKTLAFRTKTRPSAFPHSTTGRSAVPKSDVFHVREVDETGNVTVHSPKGITRGSDVMYVNGQPESQMSNSIYEKEEQNSKVAGIFDRPGMGTMAFFNNRQVAAHSLFAGDESETRGKEQGHFASRPTALLSDSIIGDMQYNPKDLPWDDEIIGNLDDGENGLTKYSTLELFLVTYKLEDYFDVFSREKIDLDALMLLEDEDLKSLNVELGPRRKLKNAIEKRRNVLRNPGAMVDTRI
ncbi:syndrome type-1G homolog [Octopus vulgaris]|uniref:Syndrome type-1G homolog n=1 Tax=Octopus vulgaris TaxID=6645 RepID=A0AA36C2J6_OCTVU|nr:syndrome type-1G homolog [Octopus vulgaris]